MKISFNPAISFIPVVKSNTTDKGKMSNISNNRMSLVALRNSQIKECVDTVSFSGLVNR